MADTLLISGLAAECRIGVFEWERAKPQTIWVDLELPVNAAYVAQTDAVGETVDYGRLVTAVRQLAQSRPYNLLETLAESIAERVLEDFETRWVRIRVKKKALPGLDYAAVEIERVRGRARGGRSRTRTRFPKAART